jgi:hypothetical protein
VRFAIKEISMKPQTTYLSSLFLFLFTVLLVLLSAGPFASAQVVTVLHKFTGGADGVQPMALSEDSAGNLYGATSMGGDNSACTYYEGCGIVYQLVQSPETGTWSDNILYSFASGSGGYTPATALLIDSAGNLYGANDWGGASNYGVVFELSPPAAPGGAWTETVLYNFAGVEESQASGLIFDAQGNLYGESPGFATGGSIFELTPPASPGGAWTHNILYSFTGLDNGPVAPLGGVAFDKNGNLYGSTLLGGSHQGCSGNSGWGTLFELAKPATKGGVWTLQVLYRFKGGDGDGAGPSGGVVFHGNKLYGTTEAGGSDQGCGYGYGTVFEVSPPTGSGGTWTETPIFSFDGSDGTGPMAGVTFDPAGNLYSTTEYNPSGPSSYGEVFELSPPVAQGGEWTQTILHSFTGHSDGGETYSGVLIGSHGVIYGTTVNGGNAVGDGDGVVYKILHAQN